MTTATQAAQSVLPDISTGSCQNMYIQDFSKISLTHDVGR